MLQNWKTHEKKYPFKDVSMINKESEGNYRFSSFLILDRDGYLRWIVFVAPGGHIVANYKVEHDIS